MNTVKTDGIPKPPAQAETHQGARVFVIRFGTAPMRLSRPACRNGPGHDFSIVTIRQSSCPLCSYREDTACSPSCSRPHVEEGDSREQRHSSGYHRGTTNPPPQDGRHAGGFGTGNLPVTVSWKEADKRNALDSWAGTWNNQASGPLSRSRICPARDACFSPFGFKPIWVKTNNLHLEYDVLRSGRDLPGSGHCSSTGWSDPHRCV